LYTFRLTCQLRFIFSRRSSHTSSWQPRAVRQDLLQSYAFQPISVETLSSRVIFLFQHVSTASTRCSFMKVSFSVTTLRTSNSRFNKMENAPMVPHCYLGHDASPWHGTSQFLTPMRSPSWLHSTPCDTPSWS